MLTCKKCDRLGQTCSEFTPSLWLETRCLFCNHFQTDHNSAVEDDRNLSKKAIKSSVKVAKVKADSTSSLFGNADVRNKKVGKSLFSRGNRLFTRLNLREAEEKAKQKNKEKHEELNPNILRSKTAILTAPSPIKLTGNNDDDLAAALETIKQLKEEVARLKEDERLKKIEYAQKEQRLVSNRHFYNHFYL
jgi:hypothetical protein